LALGASPAQLRALVLRTTFRPAVLGIALGAVATLLLTRYLGTLLFGIQPNDPATITGAALLLLLVALAAAYVPARRAGRLDPIAALKENP
ncbi:MAG: FtsX-like permease family protein, partial [Longimicrobiales bacterium]